MKNYLFSMRRTLCLLACCLGTLWLCAQPNVSVQLDTLTGGNKLVKAEGAYHSLKGGGSTIAAYTLSFEGESDSIIEVTKATYSIKRDNDEIKEENLNCHLEAGVLTIDDISFDGFNDETGVYVLSCNLEYKKVPKGEPEAEPTSQEAGSNEETLAITFYDAPTIEPGALELNAYHGKHLSMNVAKNGGNPSGWAEEWSEPTHGDYVAQNTTSEMRTETITVTVTNTAPDGETEWFNDEYTYVINIYPAPKAVLKSTPDKNLNTWDIFSGESAKLTWNTSVAFDTWAYAWKLDENDIVNPNKEYTFSQNVTDKKTYIIKTKATLGDNVYDSGEITKTFNVWPIPVISKYYINNTENAQQPFVTCNGCTVEMKIDIEGGIDDKWEYKWYYNNNLITGNTGDFDVISINNKTATLKFKNTARKTINIKVEAINSGDITSKTLSQTFTFDSYSQPTVSPKAYFNDKAITECFSKNTIQLRAEPVNPPGQGTWAYTWIGPDNNISDSDKENAQAIVPENTGSTYKDYTYQVQAMYTVVGGETLPAVVKTVTVRVYPKGSVTKEDFNTFNYLAGKHTITMQPTKKDGYPNGWTYTWKDSRTGTLQGKTELTCSVPATNYGGNPDPVTYTLEWKNSIGDNVGSSGTITYSGIRIYPEVNYPDAKDITVSAIFTDDIDDLDGIISVSEDKVREGDNIQYNVRPASGGYAWYYAWQGNGEVKDKTSYIETAVVNSNVDQRRMDHKPQTCTLTIVQRGPNGEEWDSKTITKTVEVYRKPNEPVRLERKGNNTTHTLIVNNGVDDVNGNNTLIQEYDYTYRFGYKDNANNRYLSDAVSRRYYRMSNEQFQTTADKDIWAIAQWKYSDNTIVTSNRVYISGNSTPDYTSSFYNTGIQYAPFIENGNGTDAINGITVDSDGINVVGGKLVVNFEAPTDATINVYNTSGMQLRTIRVYQQTSINEPLEMQSLTRGMYLIEVVTSNSREVKKVVIR